MSDFSNHIAIVTGGGRGIGHAIVERLAACGARVVVNSLSGSGEAVAAELRRQGKPAVAVAGDVADEADVAHLFEACRREFGPCSVLINNAGFEQRTPFEQMAVAEWDRLLAVHLRGTFLCCRAGIGDMLDASSGVIVNIVSRRGQVGGAEVSHYAAAKAGVIGLTKSLAREYSSRGIRINAIAPGPINTEIAAGFTPGWEQERLKELPLGIFGEPEDVADTVEFLVSPRSRLYVGQTFGLNCGGLMLG